MGRFTTRDSFEGNVAEPLSLHKYLYAHSNPVNLVDPSGLYVGTMEQNAAFIALAALAVIYAGFQLGQQAGSQLYVTPYPTPPTPPQESFPLGKESTGWIEGIDLGSTDILHTGHRPDAVQDLIQNVFSTDQIPRPAIRKQYWSEGLETGDEYVAMWSKQGARESVAIVDKVGDSAHVSDIFRRDSLPKGSSGKMIASVLREVGLTQPPTIRITKIQDDQPTLGQIDAGTSIGATILGGVLIKTASELGGVPTGWSSGTDMRGKRWIEVTISY